MQYLDCSVSHRFAASQRGQGPPAVVLADEGGGQTTQFTFEGAAGIAADKKGRAQ